MKQLITSLLVLCHVVLYAQFQWEETFIRPNSSRYDDIAFVNENIGYTIETYTINNKPIIDVYKTTNGFNWTIISRIENISGARSIKFYNKNIGFIGTLDSTILRTKDGGITWEDLRSKLNTTVRGICGLNITDGVVFGVGAWFGYPVFVKSEDFGDTWTIKNMQDTVSGLVDVLFLNKQQGFISGSSKSNLKATILYTEDGGLNWTQKYTYQDSIFNSLVWKMFQITDSIIYASIEQNTPISRPLEILKSTDRGMSWNIMYVDTFRGNRSQGIGFLNENIGWVGGQFPGTYETKDGGTTWERINTGGGGYNRFQKINDNLMFAAGGFIYRYGGHPNAIDDDYNAIGNKTIAADFIKSINPNPAKNNIDIELFISVKTFVSLNIYSIDGKLVKEVNHKQLPNGTHQLNCSVGDLAHGTYMLTLITNQHHDTKRFLIAE